MFAVIRAGGKQYKVTKGDVIEVERVGDSGTVEFVPLLVVDDDGTSSAGGDALAAAKVTAKVLGETKGPKIRVLRYRPKTGYRRNTGHRQRYTSLEISDIQLGKAGASRRPNRTAR